MWLADVCEVNPAAGRKLDRGQLCSFVPMESVDDWSATIVQRSTRRVGDVCKGYTPFQDGDVIVAKITPCMENGKCALARNLANGVGYGSTEFHVLRAGEKALPEWLYYFWRYPPTRRKAERFMRGSAGQQRVPAEFLDSIEIPLPPLPVQRRIAGILDKADRLRRVRRYALELSDQFLPALFLRMFDDPARNPRGWETVTLDELLATDPQNGIYKPESEYGSGTFILRIDAFYDGAVTGMAKLKSVRLTPEEVEAYRLREGDIVVNRVNSPEFLGKSALITWLRGPTVFESNMMKLDTDEGRINRVYLIHYLQTHFVKSQVLAAAKDAVNQSSINQQDVSALAIRRPPRTQQDMFARLMSVHARQAAIHCEVLRQAEHLFQSLLNQYFGEES